MSRTHKDKPYHIIVNGVKKSRSDAVHSHEYMGRERYIISDVKDSNGETVMETIQVTHIYFGQALKAELEKRGISNVEAFYSKYRVGHTIEPSAHRKPVWVQSTTRSQEIQSSLVNAREWFRKEIAAFTENETNIVTLHNVYIHGYSFYNNDIALFVRENVTRPVEQIIKTSYYPVDYCSIDVAPTAENRWGFDLPCYYHPHVHRTGWNGEYQRARKHREARRNRHVAKHEAHEVTKMMNHNGYIDENGEFEDAYVTDMLLRKRWDFN